MDKQGYERVIKLLRSKSAKLHREAEDIESEEWNTAERLYVDSDTLSCAADILEEELDESA